MKDLKMSLRKVARDLTKTAKEVEKIAEKLRAQNKLATKAAKKVTVKKVSKKTAQQPTAVDAVFGIIKRSKKGVSVATIKQKTGYDNNKIHNLVYRLKKQGKIKSELNGVYVKA